MEKVVRGKRVVVGKEPTPRPASVRVRDGKIVAIEAYDAPPGDEVAVLDFGEDLVMPGLVDSHVHVNDPIQNTPWEGFDSATASAVWGGVTTVVDMPLNSDPVTTTVARLNTKMDTARARKLHCDVAFLGGITPDQAEDDIEGLCDAGVVGFKSFLIDSGLAAFQPVSEEGVRRAMGVLRKVRERTGRETVYMF
eukprot:CAMPEP_0119137368 /NCGR_PEP_ID=MMETSP1310-20130426/23472_1 /TAXON_ID=464262 /ORGANISM="Genus nov. species nov., Strain RCC2339" /LENGTH=193 /DNA_ID=CAMNT_0007128449 /DNA_START=47 /DNA_END=625 /DNA_ORIENTATION=-